MFVYTRGQACGRACEPSAGSRVYLGAFIVASCSSSLVLVGMQLGLISDSAPPPPACRVQRFRLSRAGMTPSTPTWVRPMAASRRPHTLPAARADHLCSKNSPHSPCPLSFLPRVCCLVFLLCWCSHQQKNIKKHQLECTSVHGCVCTVKHTQLGWEANMKQMFK